MKSSCLTKILDGRRKSSRVIQDVSNIAADHCGKFTGIMLWNSKEVPAAQSAGSCDENTRE